MFLEFHNLPRSPHFDFSFSLKQYEAILLLIEHAVKWSTRFARGWRFCCQVYAEVMSCFSTTAHDMTHSFCVYWRALP